MRSTIWSATTLIFAVAGIAACSADASEPASEETKPSGSSSAPGPNSPDPAASNSSSGATSTPLPGERTLATCTATVDPNVPAFYKDYFACSDIAVNGENIVITTDGLPPHRTNYYGKDNPNYADFDTSRGAQYHANPNVLAAKKVTITIPMQPTARGVTVTQAMMDGVSGTSQIEYPLGPAGVALDSVFMFNPNAAPGDDIENEKYTFDSYNAHPTGTRLYHYHTNTPGPLEVLAARKLSTTTALGTPANIELFGIMCDGTVVLGCSELDGTAAASAGLDPQNGHIHDLKDKSNATLLANRYHTHICPTAMPGTHKFTPKIEYYATCQVK